jgi:WD40-like Beta Propeller Repeat
MQRVTSYLLLTLGALAAPIVSGAQAPPANVRKIATLTGVDLNQAILMPNGRVILYAEEGGDSVVAYDLTTRRSTLVTHGWWPELAITRAGDRIAYGHPAEDGKTSHIWTLPIDPATGTAVGPAREVTKGLGHTASFSPDGKFLAFEVHPPRADSSIPPSLLAVVPTAGGQERIVGTYPQGVGAMGWSDDGQWLLAKTQGTVVRVPVGGGSSEVVLSYSAGNGGGMIISSNGQLALYYPFRGAKAQGRLGFATATGVHGELPIPPGSDLGTYVDNGSPKSLLILNTRESGVPTTTIFELDVTPILQYIRKP